MNHPDSQIPPQLRSIYQPQLEQLHATTFSAPYGTAARLEGPIASGWFWACAIDDDCLLTTMHMVSHHAFTLIERPEVDYSVLGLLSSTDTGLVNVMRATRKVADPADPFSGGFSPTLLRNALAFSMQAGERRFEMPAGSLHDSTNICMLPSFVSRMQGRLGDGVPSLAEAFARGVELNRSTELVAAMHRIDPAHAQRAGAPLHYRALVYDALSLAAAHIAEQGRPSSRRSVLRDARVADTVTALLLASLATPPTLDELAEELYLGKTHLCEAFRRETGESIGERLAALRVAEAKRRLERGGESVSDIARAVGYAQASSFSTMFRQHTGMTPSEWRHRAGRPDR